MNKIITISREYGSGGRVIGKAVADKLGIPFYDRELIELSAQKSGLAVSFVEDTEQKIKNKFLHNLAFGGRYMGVEPAVSGLSLSDKLFIATCDIIREIADRGPCVIVGRCADYILKDRENIFDVFVYADDEHKANRIAQRNDMAPRQGSCRSEKDGQIPRKSLRLLHRARLGRERKLSSLP